ncbi:MAG: DUF2079 domain-containing protein [Leptospiraceae bacterium]|nr:DUF2079 domain-containing protein [Leptospiraceae bacterium]
MLSKFYERVGAQRLAVVVDMGVILCGVLIGITLISTITRVHVQSTIFVTLHSGVHLLMAGLCGLLYVRYLLLGRSGLCGLMLTSSVSRRTKCLNWMSIVLLLWCVLDAGRIVLLVFGAGAMSMDFPIFHDSVFNAVNSGRMFNSIQHIEIFGMRHYAEDNHPVLSTLAFHQNFILYILWPVYAWLPQPHVYLQLVPVIVMAGCATLVYKSMRTVGHVRQFALVGMLLLPFLPSMQAARQGFFPDVFGLLFLSLYFYFLKGNRKTGALLMLAGLVLVRENYFLLPALLGLQQFFLRRESRFGLQLLGLALIQFVFSMVIIKQWVYPGVDDIQAFNIFPQFPGDDVFAKLMSMFTQPLDVIRVLLRPRALVYYAIMLIPFLPFALRSSYTPVALALMGINALSGLDYAIDFRSQHAWPIALILFLGWLEVIGKRLPQTEIPDGSWKTRHLTWIVICCVAALGITQRSELSLINNMRFISGTHMPRYQVRRDRLLAMRRLLAQVPDNQIISVPLSVYHMLAYSEHKALIFPRAIDRLTYRLHVEPIRPLENGTEASDIDGPRERSEIDALEIEFRNSAGANQWKELDRVELPVYNQRLILLRRTQHR